MANTLPEATPSPPPRRGRPRAGHDGIDETTLARIFNRYRGATAAGGRVARRPAERVTTRTR